MITSKSMRMLLKHSHQRSSRKPRASMLLLHRRLHQLTSRQLTSRQLTSRQLASSRQLTSRR